MAKSSTSVSTGSITSTAEPATSTTANGTTVPLPNEAPPAEPSPATPPAAAQVDPHSALPSVATATTVTTAPAPAPTAPPSVDFQQALEGARRALTGAQEETIELRRKIRQMEAERNAADAARRDAETRAALQAVQTATAATVQAAPLQAPTAAPTVLVPATPASPPAPPYPASAIANMGATLWGAPIGISGWRIVLGIFVPLLASFAVGSLVYELAAFGVTVVATASSFFLWPLLILVMGAIAALYLMYKTFGVMHGYIDSGKAEAHWHTVWGWLSSPLRVVETQDKVLAVEGKVDRLLLTQGVTP